MYSHAYVNSDTDVIAAFSLVCDLTLDLYKTIRLISKEPIVVCCRPSMPQYFSHANKPKSMSLHDVSPLNLMQATARAGRISSGAQAVSFLCTPLLARVENSGYQVQALQTCEFMTSVLQSSSSSERLVNDGAACTSL